MKYVFWSNIFLITTFCFLSFVLNKEQIKETTITIEFKKDTIPPKPACDSVKHIIIGDSQTPFVDNQSTKVNRVSTTSGMSSLWQGGKTLSWLVQALEGYKTDSCVVSVVFCIGTNGGYSSKDNVEKLITLTKEKFPNSKLYAVQGSWGWGGIKDVTETRVRTYYKRFEKLGVTIIEPPIGRIEPHGNKPVYKIIGKNIDSILQI